MPAIKSILRRLGLLDRGEAVDREIEDELRFHLEMRTRDNIVAGMPPEEAATDAMRRFGDFDHVRAMCQEIKKERLAGNMKMFKGLIWVMLGCGLTLKLAAGIDALQNVGEFLILIATLWRLLIHLREMQPDQHRIRAAEQPALSITHVVGDSPSDSFAEQPFNPVPAYDKDGRTPVERLLSDDGSAKP